MHTVVFLIYRKGRKKLHSFAQIFGRILRPRLFIDRVQTQQAHSYMYSSMNSPDLKIDLHKSFLPLDKNLFLSWKLMQKTEQFSFSEKERSMSFHCPHLKQNWVQSTSLYQNRWLTSAKRLLEDSMGNEQYKL